MDVRRLVGEEDGEDRAASGRPVKLSSAQRVTGAGENNLHVLREESSDDEDEDRPEEQVEASSTGGLLVAEADLAPQPGMRQKTSQTTGCGVGTGRKLTFLTLPRGQRSGLRNAASVTSLNNTRACAPLGFTLRRS